MKLIKLLSRYLSGCRSRQSRRNRTPVDQAAGVLTHMDIELERRLLLSATSDSQHSDAPGAASNVGGGLSISSASFDSSDRLTISLDDGAALFVTSAFSVVAQESEGEAAPEGYVVISTASNRDSGSVTQYHLQFDGTGGRLVQISTADSFEGEIASRPDVLAEQPANPLTDQIIEFSQQQPISNDLLAELLAPKSDGSSYAAKSGPTDASRTLPAVATVHADDVGSTADASVALDSVLVDASTDLFFSIADTPLWDVDATEQLLRLHDAAGSSNRPVIAPTGIEPVGQSIRQRQQSASLGLAVVRSQRQTTRAAGDNTDIFTTSESRTAFARLLNSLVQFGTSELLDSDSKLSDWLSEQLDLASENNGSADLEVATTNTAYADSTDVLHDEQRIERLQQAYLKIDFLLTGAAAVAVLSGHSLGPPEITGMWQRICFECNPRGPPVSDSNSGSGIHQMSAGCVQLQQLRYSISPRGPSVVSVN